MKHEKLERIVEAQLAKVQMAEKGKWVDSKVDRLTGGYIYPENGKFAVYSPDEPGRPQKVFTTEQEAIRWLETRTIDNW